LVNQGGRRVKTALAVGIIVILHAACATQQVRQPIPRQSEPEANRVVNYEILDYEGKAAGGNIPAWVFFFLDGNQGGIEMVSAYRDRYVFFAVNSGGNFRALEQWQNAFSPGLDFSRLVTTRIEKRFLDAAAAYPDDEYGSYYESLIRAAADAEWTGAVKSEIFWVRRRFPDADGLALRAESYDFLVLVTIEKRLLVPQIQALFRGINPPTPLLPEQQAAVNRVVERFFEGF
jgi:hypothetical protein